MKKDEAEVEECSTCADDTDTEGEEAGDDLSPAVKAKMHTWEREQERLKSQLEEVDSKEVISWRGLSDPFEHMSYIAGADISFEKENPNHACTMLAILSFPDLQVVHLSQATVVMTEPYVPGFLAFREVDFLLDRLRAVRTTCPQYVPQAVLVDGNGVLHPRGFGLASHLGVLSGIPCIGVGKKLYHVDGLEKSPEHMAKIRTLSKKGDFFDLVGASGQVWGRALRTSDSAQNPVYVSVGHKFSLETATKLVIACSVKRIPEPIRQADIQSREFLRKEKQKK